MAIAADNANGASVDFVNAAALRTDPITCMHWCRWRADTGNTTFGVWEGVNRAWRMSASTAPTEMRSRISTDGANQLSTSSSTAITIGAWNHFALMYDGTDLDVWINGVLDATSVDVGGLFASTADFSIGGQEAGGNTSDTDQADIRIYSRILSAAEMQTIFAARGHDGIVEGLELRAPANDAAIGILTSAVNPKDVGPAQIAFSGAFGVPVPDYVENGGLSFRRKVA